MQIKQIKQIIGLIYKDFASNRYLLLVQILFIGIMGSITLAALFTDGEIPTAASIIIFAVIAYVGGSILPETAIQSDIASRWNVYALTLPTAARLTVLAKFTLMLFMYTISFILSIVFAAIAQAISTEYVFDIFPLVTIFAFIVGFDAITYALVFRFGYKKGTIFKALGVFAVPAAAMLYLLFGDLRVFGENGIYDFLDWLIAFDLSTLFDKLWLPMVIFGVVSFGVCYWLGCVGYRSGLETVDN